MKISTRLTKRTKVLALGAVLLLTAAAVPAVTMAGFGPDRPTKAYTDGVKGFDYVTFNSFTGVPGVGDERNFANAKYQDATGYADQLNQVKDGDTLTIQVYVHNNASSSLNDNAGQTGIARNTKVRVALPTAVKSTQQATAYISADNAQPQEVTDTVDFGGQGGANFGLEYVPGSAKLNGNYANNVALADSIVTTGAPVGTVAANGDLKGCFKEMVYVTLQVKVKMPQYNISKQVRMAGQTSKDWTENKTVNAGDTTQWLVTFKNTGKTALNDVAIVDQVPAGLTVVPGSVKLINGNYPNGYVYPANAIQDNGRTINVKIGNYNPDAAGVAYVIYDTKVDALGKDVCSDQDKVNKAFATPAGFGAIFDTASVTVKTTNKCETTPPKTPVYSCESFTLTPGENRSVTALVKANASNGATLKTVTYDFGDKTTPYTTNDFASAAKHTYAADGTYNVKTTLLFSVNGKDQTVVDAKCAKPVSFTTPGTPTTPTELPNTGAGEVLAVFLGASVAGAIAHRLFASRRIARS